MDTLITDLRQLLSKQFTVLHDVFLNNEDHQESKDIKLAAKTKNWKWISYFLDRYEYDGYVLRKLQLGAYEGGDVAMIDTFNNSHSFSTKCFKYLAVGRHHDLINQYIGDTGVIGGISRTYLFQGFIIADDLEIIKFALSARHQLSVEAPPPSAYYVVGEYNRSDILAFFKEHFEYTDTMDYQYTLGQISGGFYPETNEIINRPVHELEHMMNALAMHRKYHQICKQILAKYPDNDVLIVRYIEVSLKCGYFEVLDEYGTLDTSYPILYSASKLDDLDLFIKYHNRTIHQISRLVLEACEFGAIKILLYLLNLEESVAMKLEGYTKIGDPRVARILINSKVEVQNVLKFIDIAYVYSYNKVAKILSKQE